MKKINKNVVNNSQFIKNLVNKSIFNVGYYRTYKWANFYFNKMKRTKGSIKSNYQLKDFQSLYVQKYFDLKEFVQFVTRLLFNLRMPTLSKKLNEEQRFEFQLEYVEAAVEYLKEGAFKDDLVVDTLNKLRVTILSRRLPLTKRREYKTKFDQIIDKLRIDDKVSGKECLELPSSKDLINMEKKLRSILKAIYSTSKKRHNRSPESDLRRRFPPLNDDEMLELKSLVSKNKTAEAARYLISIGYSSRPRTVQDKLQMARKASQQPLQNHVLKI